MARESTSVISVEEAEVPSLPDVVPGVVPEAEAVPAKGPGRAERGGGGGRLRALDGMRFLAALLVCFFHYVGHGGAPSNAFGESPRLLFPNMAQAAIYGNLGVQIFFVISGFVICMSGWGRSLGSFFRSRVSRLYPAYWVALLMLAGATAAWPVLEKRPGFGDLLVNLTMLQSPMGVPRVLGVDWTLWVEARFYLLFALFVLWKGASYRRVVQFCILWLVAGALTANLHIPLLDLLTVRNHAPFFIGGLALYLMYRFGSDLTLWSILIASYLLGQKYVIDIIWQPDAVHPYITRTPVVIMLGLTLGYVLVGLVALRKLEWANWRWLTYAGALTYPFYLIHEHLGYMAIYAFRHNLELTPREALAATVVLMLALAAAIHWLVEKPVGRRLRKGLERQVSGKILLKD
ncbi:acyltransferase family protein [Actinacidiphila soli]|uniref:acyltransferase family protein n=1 Tax=Actinacidiphila soli TaxID=2487275 RepID=UPI001F0BDCAE|nr:acyltransferase [Actinacidiphila soli]